MSRIAAYFPRRNPAQSRLRLLRRALRAPMPVLAANHVGLAVFGTNSEANSITTGERIELLEQLVEGGPTCTP